MITVDHNQTDLVLVPATRWAYIVNVTIQKGATGTNPYVLTFEEAGGSTAVFGLAVPASAYASITHNFEAAVGGWDGLQVTSTGDAGDNAYIEVMAAVK